jgi:hypothetical protein
VLQPTPTSTDHHHDCTINKLRVRHHSTSREMLTMPRTSCPTSWKPLLAHVTSRKTPNKVVNHASSGCVAPPPWRPPTSQRKGAMYPHRRSHCRCHALHIAEETKVIVTRHKRSSNEDSARSILLQPRSDDLCHGSIV